MKLWYQSASSYRYEEVFETYGKTLEEQCQRAARPDTEVYVTGLPVMMREIDRFKSVTYYHKNQMLNHMLRAEKEGYDAAIPGCFYDPGLREAREITDRIVVTAPAEASMLIAAMLGHRFSIIVGRKKWIPKMHENVVNYGLVERLASFESVDLGVEGFQKDKEETERRLTEAAQRAVEERLAEVIIHLHY